MPQKANNFINHVGQIHYSWKPLRYKGLFTTCSLQMEWVGQAVIRPLPAAAVPVEEKLV
jgi:hypothetical protein